MVNVKFDHNFTFDMSKKVEFSLDFIKIDSLGVTSLKQVVSGQNRVFLPHVKTSLSKAMFHMFAMSFVARIDATFSIPDLLLKIPFRHTAVGFLKNLTIFSMLSFL